MKKLLFAEKQIIQEALQKAEKLADVVNEFGRALQKEGSQLTSKILSDFYEKGSGSLESLFFNVALKLLKVKPEKVNSALRSGIWSGAEAAAKTLAGHQEKIHIAQQSSGILHSDLEIINGKASISDSMKAKIEEKYSYFLNPADEELYTRISGALEYLEIEDAHLSLVSGKGLIECLKTLANEDSRFSVNGPYRSTLYRKDLPLVKNNMGRIICNPAWFDSRVNTSAVSTDKTNKKEEE